MSEYNTIKELVIETCKNEGFFPSYERLTAKVLKNFPTSKWKKSHWHWYKNKIKRGEIHVPGFEPKKQIINSFDDTDTDNEVQESIEASLSIERDLHNYLAGRVNEIEEGLQLVEDGVEYQTDAGHIDLFARDKQGNNVVIELKAAKAKDSSLGQLLGYMGCIASTSAEHVQTRGILVAFDFEQRVIYAARGLHHVKLIKYQVSFELHEVT